MSRQPYYASEPFVTYPPSPFSPGDGSFTSNDQVTGPPPVHADAPSMGSVGHPGSQPPTPAAHAHPMGGMHPADVPHASAPPLPPVSAPASGLPQYEPLRDVPQHAAAAHNLMTPQPSPGGMSAAIPAVPPDWVPDDKVVGCMRCAKHFTLLARRHHCRVCGRIYCAACCSNFSLLPRQFNRAEPQRVCVRCFEALLPLQRQLMLTVSKAARDGDYRQPTFNAPTTRSMRKEIAKAAATLAEFGGMPDARIPVRLLHEAKGVAFFTMLKGGFIWAGKMGTGLVVARNPTTGGWSAPSAIGAVGCSFGLQAGGELNSVVLVLNTDAALNAFTGTGHITLGAGVSMAVGPWGRSAEAEAGGGDAGAIACYSYCTAKGAFAGLAVESTLMFCRSDLNQMFYGRPVTPKQLLSGQIPPPRAAGPLYRALETAMTASTTTGGANGVGGIPGGLSG